MVAMLADVEPESQASETVGRVVPLMAIESDSPKRDEPNQ
jgi:hypothetical protein